MNFVLWQGIAALGCRPAIEDYRAEAHSRYGARVGGKRSFVDSQESFSKRYVIIDFKSRAVGATQCTKIVDDLYAIY